MMANNRGVIYGVSGLPYLNEALVSAHSIKQHIDGLATALFIDKHSKQLIADKLDLSSLFDHIKVYDDHQHWRSNKFAAMANSPFQQTLFLDADTYVCEQLNEGFTLLEQFDLAAVPAPQRIHPKSINSGLLALLPSAPFTFPEYNTGVIFYNKTEQFQLLLDEWQRLYLLGREKLGYEMDQPAFRIAFYYSSLRMASLSVEYNFRAGTVNLLKDKVKIVHAHGDLAQIALIVNQRLGVRLMKPMHNLVDGMSPTGVIGVETYNQTTEQQIDTLKETFKRLSWGI